MLFCFWNGDCFPSNFNYMDSWAGWPGSHVIRAVFLTSKSSMWWPHGSNGDSLTSQESLIFHTNLQTASCTSMLFVSCGIAKPLVTRMAISNFNGYPSLGSEICNLAGAKEDPDDMLLWGSEYDRQWRTSNDNNLMVSNTITCTTTDTLVGGLFWWFHIFGSRSMYFSMTWETQYTSISH